MTATRPLKPSLARYAVRRARSAITPRARASEPTPGRSIQRTSMHTSVPRRAEGVAVRAASGVAAAMVAVASLTAAAPAAVAYGACELVPGNGVEWCDIKVGKGEAVGKSDTIEMVYQVRSMTPCIASPAASSKHTNREPIESMRRSRAERMRAGE